MLQHGLEYPYCCKPSLSPYRSPGQGWGKPQFFASKCCAIGRTDVEFRMICVVRQVNQIEIGASLFSAEIERMESG